MGTLVAVAQHKNQFSSRNNDHGPGRFGSFGSPGSRDYKGINCRSYQSGVGLLPTPVKTKSCTTPITNRAFSASLSPKTLSSSVKLLPEEPKKVKKSVRSSAISIPIKMKNDDGSLTERSFSDDFCFSELWAGPAYSNSPPPSSVPMPKFAIKPKRTISFELPSSVSATDLRPIAKSAPASPTSEHSFWSRDFFDDSDSARGTCEHSFSPRDFSDDTDCATKTLRRILNLDVSDE